MPINDYSRLPGPSLLKQTLGHQNRQYTSYLGLTGEFDTAILKLFPFDEKGEDISILGTFRRVIQNDWSPQTHFIIKSDTDAEVKWEIACLDEIEAVVAPHGPALVDIYFRIVHPSFPILHKRVFLEKHGRSYRELTPLGLIAVYILALGWWSYSLDLSSLVKPDVKILELLIPKLMSECYKRPKISDLQAGLVLSQLPEQESWALTAQLVAMAQNLGIHDDCSAWKIPDWERGVRKRVAWALYAQDKWGAMIYGRPSHIVDSNWDVQPLEVQDFPETAVDDDDGEGSADVEKGRLIFVHHISLTKILADILATFFTLKASKKPQTTLEALEQAKPLQIRLKSWYSDLPARLSIDETKARKLSSTGYLHLAYFSLEVTLHRAIIRSLCASTPVHLRQIVRTAAKARLTSAIEFLQRLKPQHLQSFWYFSSKLNLAIIGTFGSVLWATSDTVEECELYKAQLAEYRWTLRISSSGAEFMKYALDILDASTVFLCDFTVNMTALNGLSSNSVDGTEYNEHALQIDRSANESYNLNGGEVPDFASYSNSTWANINFDNSETSTSWFEQAVDDPSLNGELMDRFTAH